MAVAETLLELGCPGEYIQEYTHPFDAIERMGAAGDVAALEAWRDSPSWEQYRRDVGDSEAELANCLSDKDAMFSRIIQSAKVIRGVKTPD